jgi:hypothetical protein
VQRIKQVIHPVGRGKKKQVLLHIIQENNWSQVLVFTRTKFGANNVAEYLTKNGVSAMALHGNKSQSARTQALEGFKTGELRPGGHRHRRPRHRHRRAAARGELRDPQRLRRLRAPHRPHRPRRPRRRPSAWSAWTKKAS